MDEPSIISRNMGVEFPVLNGKTSRSLLGSFTSGTVGGLIGKRRDGTPRVQALSRINLSLNSGDRLAIIGRNGAGKSTLLRVLSGVLPPTQGELAIHGTINNLLTLGQGFDAELSGRENITRALAIAEVPKEQHAEVVANVCEFAELGSFIEMPFRTYSSGMMMRLMTGVHTAIPADIFIADEVIGAGDLYFMERARQRVVGNLESSKIIVLATHSGDTVKQFCNKGIVIHKGRILFQGSAEDAWKGYASGELERNAMLAT